jgi:hypothetical protein
LSCARSITASEPSIVASAIEIPTETAACFMRSLSGPFFQLILNSSFNANNQFTRPVFGRLEKPWPRGTDL